jgi:hypothetical protein
MRKFFTAVGCAALVLPLLPATGVSQEESGDLGMVMSVEIAPAHRAAYREALESLTEAAAAAGVTDYSWHFWSNDTGYLLYYPIDDFAYFDDPDQLWRSFEGTKGQAGRDEFFAAMQAIPSHSTTEIIESIPSLEYWPEDFSDVGAVHLHYEYVDGANEDAWMENAAAWIGFFEKIGYPYGARAYRTRIGDDRMTWAFFVPGLSEFHSDASWDDLVEAAGAGAEMEVLIDDWNAVVDRMEHTSAGFVESMTYDPA